MTSQIQTRNFSNRYAFPGLGPGLKQSQMTARNANLGMQIEAIEMTVE